MGKYRKRKRKNEGAVREICGGETPAGCLMIDRDHRQEGYEWAAFAQSPSGALSLNDASSLEGEEESV